MVMPEIASAALRQAIDFLFGEFKRILAERRERRQEMREPDDTTTLPAGVEESTKEGICRLGLADLDEEVEKEAEFILVQIKIFTKHRRVAWDKINFFGGLRFVTPNVRAELESAEEGLLEWSQRLKALLEKVYGQRIHIDGLK